ncbi:MAG: diguanylate cyclase [Solirubrobacterales bacterium]|nr:diguanylate cyclase [Solirubrobacterales bacterium]
MDALPSRAARAAVWAALAALAVHVAHGLTGFGGHAVDLAVEQWLYDGLVAAAAAGCWWRVAAVRRERLAWALVAAALTTTAAAELLWSLRYAYDADPPFPSVADALWLAYYPLVYAGFVLLAHGRRGGARFWLDGLAAALAAAAVTAATLAGPALEQAGSEPAEIATNAAYPIGDLLVLTLVIGLFAATGWSPGRRWAVLGLGMAVAAVTDGAFLVQTATGSYTEGTLLDSGWLVAYLLVAGAALLPAERPPDPGAVPAPWRLLVAPGVVAIGSLALLVADHFTRLDLAPVLLATAALVALAARAGLTYVQDARRLARSQEEALMDGLTGLGNRRALHRDLQAALRRPDDRVLVLFDLDGFKAYNDTFGHPAGDALLARLGHRLAATLGGRGRAYRMGGDEFCALLRGGDAEVQRAAAALVEHGEGFAVTASHGAVALRDVEDVAGALRAADQRMYAAKGRRGPTSLERQARDVLLSAMAERDGALGEQLRDVADLALAVGRRMALDAEALDVLSRAAELHDIGKVAVPDAVLLKPGTLTEDELAFVRRHTVMGERILGAAPALRPVARLVRSSHERWDGAGYPDGLAGEAIPLGARIVAVCDAYDAMTTDRPHRRAVGMDEALAELRRCAGTQFDPAVVAHFCAVAEGIRDALSRSAG